MNKQFLRNWVLCITLATAAMGSSEKVWADDQATALKDGDVVEVNLVDAINNAPDEVINQAVQNAGNQIVAAVPGDAPDDKVVAIRENVNQLNIDSKKPGFKAHMAEILKGTGHVGKKGGILLLKATGIGSSAVLGATISPFVITANMVTSAISGHGMIATHLNTDPNSLDTYDASYGEFGGAVSEVYVLVALYAAGFTVEPLVLFDTIIARAIQLSICGVQNPGPELQSYCRLSNGTYRHIIEGSAIVGDVIGKGIHLSIVIPAHLIGKLFHRHHTSAPAPTVQVQAPLACGIDEEDYGRACVPIQCNPGLHLVAGECVQN